MKFKDLNFKSVDNYPGGVQALHFFPNGYGVSVVQSQMSYGGDRGLYELAVVKGDKTEYHLNYDTPITDDVIGNLTPNGVEIHFNRVQEL